MEDIVAAGVGVAALFIVLRFGRYLLGLFASGVEEGLKSDEPVHTNVATELVAAARAKASAVRDRAELERSQARSERTAAEIAKASSVALAGAMKWDRWENAVDSAVGAEDIIALGALLDAQRQLCFEQATASAMGVSCAFAYIDDVTRPLDRPDQLVEGGKALEMAAAATSRCFKLLNLSRAAQAVAGQLDLDNYDSPSVEDEATALHYMQQQLERSPDNFAATYLRLHDAGVEFVKALASVLDDPARFSHTQEASLRAASYLTRLRYALAGASLLRDGERR